MNKTLDDIAKLVGGEVVGDGRTVITGLSGIKEAQEGDLSFVANDRYFALVESTRASAVITPRHMEGLTCPSIRTDNPSLAFARIASLLIETETPHPRGVHPTAVVAADAVLGRDVAVGPYAVIEAGAEIGDRTMIYSGAYIGAKVGIGADSLIYPHVTIRERVVIGRRVIIHSGTVIGADGFGFVTTDGIHEKIPQLGIVEVEDDVEIGANVTVDRARFDKTVIGRGTKIDNLVQIAHNVRIGKNCIIVSQVGISGSTIIEDNVTLAGQVGVAGHLTIGAGAVVASKSGVPSSLGPKAVYWGIPAKPIMEAKRVNACVQRLPNYVKIIQDLQKRVAELESRMGATADG